MKSVYDEIYKKAKLYWDTRLNDVHVPVAYDFAKRLLAHYPEADPDIVLPAILLHDVGWKMVPAERQMEAFGPKAKDEAANQLHEAEGVRIAREILTSLNYDRDKTQAILTIIEGHDSREEALSLNDKLVKDADRLWRYTPKGIEVDYQRFDVALEPHLTWLEAHLDPWLFTPEAKGMARQMLADAKLRL